MSDEIQIPDNQQEDENDISPGVKFRKSVVVNADWTIETINLQIDKGNIDLQPQFQRRAAWDDIRKSRLVESIIVGMPVPNIVLAENKEQRGQFIVIDGKQRLISVSAFVKDEYPLKGLDIRPDLNGRRYSQLPIDDKNNFDNSTLRSTVIRNWEDEDFLYVIFYRLNSGSLPLSPQELRKALVGGNLIDHIEVFLTGSAQFKTLFGENLDKRMRDSELILRFLAFDNFLPNYQGDFKKFLDDATRHFETNWHAKQADVDASLDRLNKSLAAAHQIFGASSFKKWIGDKYERVMNRAVFDCIARFFADQLVRDLAVLKADEVAEDFKMLCQDAKFKESVERTTKTKEATFYRIDAWGEKLAARIGRHYDNQARRIV